MLFPDDDRPSPSWFAKAAPLVTEKKPAKSLVAARDLNIKKALELRWIPGGELRPDMVDAWSSEARGGFLRTWLEFGSRAEGLGYAPQMLKFRELVRSAEYRVIHRPKGAGSLRTKGLSAEIMSLSKQAHAYVEEAFLEHLPDFFAATGVDAYHVGLGVALPHFEPRGYADRWESLAGIETIASSRLEYVPMKSKFFFYGDPSGVSPYDVAELQKIGALLFLERDEHRHLDERGLLWILVKLWLFYQFVMRYWMENVQDYGKPIITADHDPGDGEGEEVAQEIIDRLAQDLRAVKPRNVNLEILQAVAMSRGNEGGSHQQLAEYLRRDFDQIWFGHTHASGAQVGTGSRTSGNKADDDMRRMVNGFLKWAAKNTEGQLTTPAIARNMGQRAARVVSPRISAFIPAPRDAKTVSEIIANVVPVGMKIGPDDAANQLGFSVVEDGDPYLMPLATGAAPGSPFTRAIPSPEDGEKLEAIRARRRANSPEPDPARYEELRRNALSVFKPDRAAVRAAFEKALNAGNDRDAMLIVRDEINRLQGEGTDRGSADLHAVADTFALASAEAFRRGWGVARSGR